MRKRATQSDAVLAAALEAAADRASRLARQVIMAARLATAVHLRREAESDPAPGRRATQLWVTSTEAAPEEAAAARLVRGGQRP